MNDGRSDSFIPLSTTPLPDGRRPDLRVTVLKPEESSPPFQPLVIAREPPPTTASFTPRPASAGCEPRVSVAREGERVSAIRIQCTCGQMIELACVYSPPGK